MSYFKKFPTVGYTPDSVTGDTDFRIVTDILRRVALRSSLVEDAFLYDEYDIREGERPDIIADQFYGDSNLHWVILITNEIHDIVTEWPLSTRELQALINGKYTNPQGVHHYERNATSGDTTVKVYCNQSDTGATAVSNADYETRLNEEKRRIKLLKKEALSEFIEEFEDLIKR
jgi:hypothetical protein